MQPRIKKRDNQFSIAFFDNKTKDGKDYIGVMLSRHYKTKENEDKYEDLHIYPEDLLKISSLCLRAYNEYKDSAEDKSSVPTSDAPF